MLGVGGVADGLAAIFRTGGALAAADSEALRALAGAAITGDGPGIGSGSIARGGVGTVGGAAVGGGVLTLTAWVRLRRKKLAATSAIARAITSGATIATTNRSERLRAAAVATWL